MGGECEGECEWRGNVRESGEQCWGRVGSNVRESGGAMWGESGEQCEGEWGAMWGESGGAM